jgi:hypothetical protein
MSKIPTATIFLYVIPYPCRLVATVIVISITKFHIFCPTVFFVLTIRPEDVYVILVFDVLIVKKFYIFSRIFHYTVFQNSPVASQ